MKKGLLLSIAASVMIFAGGDIAPVEPAAPASADFWGQIGFAYQFQDEDWKGLDFGDTEDNAFSTSLVLGVEKELGAGFGFGAELAGWTDFGLDIADGSRVESGDQTSAEVSQAYLTYTFGNTAIKVMPATAFEYLKMVAISRIVLDNFQNIQASWVTQGPKVAQLALYFGANDFGSTMIEENVVAAAGVHFRMSLEEMISTIKEAGFTPAQRDTLYNIIKTYP